jgi:hypothetical protein
MPLKLQVGLQQKVGLPAYSSLGASCHVELELDGQLLERSPGTFQHEVERAFAACREAVQTELARQQPATQNGQTPHTTNGHRAQTDAARRATQSQLRALRAIASRHGFDLAADVQQRFGIAQPEELDLQQASQLIDELNHTLHGSRA